MTVYIEYVLLDNFVIDYFILIATSNLVNVKAIKIRIVSGALLGAVFALVLPFLSFFGFTLFIVKVSGGLLIVFIAFKYKGIKEFYVTALTFLSLSFLSGGIVSGIYSLLKIEKSTDISIAFAAVLLYLSFKYLSRLKNYFLQRIKTQKNSFTVEIESGGKVIFGKGFLDSGNFLYRCGQAVIFAEKKAFSKLLAVCDMKNVTKVEFSTVDSRAHSMALKNQTVKIYFKDNPNIFNNVTVALSKSVPYGYDFILNSDMTEGEYEQVIKEDIKTAV